MTSFTLDRRLFI